MIPSAVAIFGKSSASILVWPSSIFESELRDTPMVRASVATGIRFASTAARTCSQITPSVAAGGTRR